ncbi:MAG: DUF4910 domain-containing protein [Candidatus Aminicenantes bacterium]|nr:MAG: DUF4910 domain-containing protein [Candidatus Aminicenantes bacterium]
MNKANKRFISCLLLLMFFLALSYMRANAQAKNPVIKEGILNRIANEVSGSICFEHIRYLSTLHRTWGSRDYHRAAEYFVDKSVEYGLSEAEIEKYPVKTGRESFWMHSAGGNVPWDLRSGEFRLVEPFPMLITHYENAPSTVARGSRSTDTKAELVYVGRGDSEDDYKDIDVRGKIVLAEGGRHERVHELAVHRFGALGTVQFYNRQGNYLESEGIYWAGIMPWSHDGKKVSTFGVNLSTSRGLHLKSLLEKSDKVVVSVRIEAEIVPDGVYELATAVIPGSAKPEEEFIFYAHLDHPKPGAHDNASGDAVLLEIARTLSSLIQKEIIPPPKRSIRFMWIPHMSGLNMYFFHHQDKIGKVKGGCNVDCVGVNQSRFPTKFHVALPPHSLPTFLTDITINLVDYVNHMLTARQNMLFSPEGSRNEFSVTLRSYLGASDEYTANTNSLNIPSIYFFDSPLPPRHNQINFLEYIDRTNLKRIAYLGAIISYAYTSAGEEIVPLLHEINYRGKERLESELLKANILIESSTAENIHQNYAKARNLLFWGSKREKGMLSSVKKFILDKKQPKLRYSEYSKLLDEYIEICQGQLRRFYEAKCKNLNVRPLKVVPKAKKLDPSWEKTVPVLSPKIKGSIGYFSNYLEDKLGEGFLTKYKGVRGSIKYGNVGYYEAMNYVDGKNTVADIYEAVHSELWSGDYSAYHYLTFEEMTNFFKMLRDADVITF